MSSHGPAWSDDAQARAAARTAVGCDFHSALVEDIRAAGGTLRAGRFTFRLAKEFGFCYGVDHALDLAYETRRRFPGRAIHLTGEIIHNPTVNERLDAMGFRFFNSPEEVGRGDIVLIPAFGAPVGQLQHLRDRGCFIVDTTCGSVVHVWKRVERYARDGFTTIIHGKYAHEETAATRSQTELIPGSKYLVLKDKHEADAVAAFIRGELDAADFRTRFAKVSSPGFNPETDLDHIGLANQTTMLASESLEIADLLRAAMADRWGEEEVPFRFRSFDTICSATQERQDAVHELLAEPPDLMLVVGGYNSSNTGHLAEIASEVCSAFHIDRPECLISPERIHHLPPFQKQEIETADWLPAGPITIGLTAGASTPNRVLGDCIERIIKIGTSPTN